MQGELYTAKRFGMPGHQEMDYEKLISERPEYFLFNGAVGALTKSHPMRARPGETVRIFFGVGGPNFTSSFHVIGEIFDHEKFYGKREKECFAGGPRGELPAAGIHAGGPTKSAPCAHVEIYCRQRALSRPPRPHTRP